jgi:hypothetical protein
VNWEDYFITGIGIMEMELCIEYEISKVEEQSKFSIIFFSGDSEIDTKEGLSIKCVIIIFQAWLQQ